MLSSIIKFSIHNKLVVFLFIAGILGYGIFAVQQISIGTVPDITNNQVQVITTSRSLSTVDMEQFITYPVELEMINLPGIKEVRSISKFGLSVVTLVFEDDLGTYLPRQLIAEKIKAAAEKIPEGFGSPEMGPITTGLGEIYQYVLDVKPGYEHQYTITDLRTIQDWIVKRQLSGIPGVVEVNTWGGYLKQYEVAVEASKLRSLNMSIGEVFRALEKNNSVAGGAYIEKGNQSYFIRGDGLIDGLDDIKNIAVKTVNGVPVYIRDIAKVHYGTATRFGAITANGEGEKVMGQVMMLKGANSKQVIDEVKKKVEELSRLLPEGVYVNAFLERGTLIEKSMFTVKENLVLGCLIVVFVVVLLLGNLRSGLVVASIIPLCLLFAISFMHLFHVDANLMSLGAIDFGIIIDGAVIIVEFIAFKITQRSNEIEGLSKNDAQKTKDLISFQASSKMMNSAIFGQLIILIVFIPILSLSGVEGKMFRPMALVFSFALIGAVVLCITYVPVMASIFIKPSLRHKKNVSHKIMNTIKKWYIPLIEWALRKKKIVLSAVVLLLCLGVGIFSTLGGEFVPTLDEGDFVIQPILKTGTSLSETVEITTRIEKILKNRFSEVDQVVSRIGAAEVPTDPMSMEESDVIITLKDKKHWVIAENKDELADKFKEALSVIPGMEVEFTQPIEMRFNELITGVRADIAIKIFGNDLEKLTQLGSKVKVIAEGVDGAADVTLEKIAGLPQMSVKYNRAKIAKYGLSINDVNDVLAMAFGGKIAGHVFEEERKFDVVIRLDTNDRKSIDDIKNLYVNLPNGGFVLLSDLATITYEKAPAKISRDQTHRRIVVGINVRNRDLKSVVEDIQAEINKNLNMPEGYYLEYGGQFKNLQNATRRLLIAVPIALVLIFIMLYFAFKSIKEALIIYAAIPFSAIGGVILLWLRNLPFSISAGIGFIALFGIAVLNGLVLLEHFKELDSKGNLGLKEVVVQGTVDRLRAVLLTALSAALGFLPMAISTNVGAEVQRPLATVVIGGLITSTILTLVVVPVLYVVFYKPVKRKMISNVTLLLLLGILPFSLTSQNHTLNLHELTTIALQNNPGMLANKLEVERSKELIKTAYAIDKTSLYYARDENNLAINNKPLNVFGVQQDFAFPSVYARLEDVKKSESDLEEIKYQIGERNIKQNMAVLYCQYQAAKQKEVLYGQLDSLYGNFSNLASRRFELGETNYLEKITAQSKQKQVENQLIRAKTETQYVYRKILQLIHSSDSVSILYEKLKKVDLEYDSMSSSLELLLYEKNVEVNNAKIRYKKNEKLPDLSLQVFNGINNELMRPGIQVGLKVPFFSKAYSAQVQSAVLEKNISENMKEAYTINLQTMYQTLLGQYRRNKKAIEYYEKEGTFLANEIIKTAEKSYQNGEIDFFNYLQSIESAYQLNIEAIEAILEYNTTVINLNYLSNSKYN